MGVELKTKLAPSHARPTLPSLTDLLLYLEYLQVWNISYLQV